MGSLSGPPYAIKIYKTICPVENSKMKKTEKTIKEGMKTTKKWAKKENNYTKRTKPETTKQ